MIDFRDKAMTLLSLPQSELRSMDPARLATFQFEFSRALSPDSSAPVDAMDFVALGGPATADLDSENGARVLAGFRFSCLRDWEVDLDQNAILMATDLLTGTSAVSRPLLRSDKRRSLLPKPSQSGPRPEGTTAKARLTGVELLDLRKLLPTLTRHPGRLSLTFAIHDRASNGHVVQLTSQAFAPPAPPSSMAVSPWAHFVPRPKDISGIRLHVPGPSLPASAIRIGAFIEISRDRIAAFENPADPDSWVSPVSIVLLKLDDPRPKLVTSVIPVRLTGEKILAACELDLSVPLRGEELRGPHQLYLLAGTEVAGPYPLEVLP